MLHHLFFKFSYFQVPSDDNIKFGPEISPLASVLIVVACIVLLLVWAFTLFLLFRKVYGCTETERREIVEAKDAVRLAKWRGEREKTRGNTISFCMYNVRLIEQLLKPRDWQN